jgi:serine/threonine protein kinase
LQRARQAELFRHRNIAEVHAVGETQGTYFSVGQWLDGMTLERYVQRHGSMPTVYALRLLIPCAQALAAAHRAGILHGDVRPSNIFVCSPTRGEGERACVQNFGYGMLAPVSAQAVRSRDESWREFHYVPPEALQGMQAGVRGDIFAFGMTLYRVLVGTPPANLHELSAGGTGQLRALMVQRIAPAVAEVIARATAQRAIERYDSLEELADDLAEHLRTRDSLEVLRRSPTRETQREMVAVPAADSAERARLRSAVTAPGLWHAPEASASAQSSAPRTQLATTRTDVAIRRDVAMRTERPARLERQHTAPPPLPERWVEQAHTYSWIKLASEISAIDRLSDDDYYDAGRSYARPAKSWYRLMTRGVAYVCVCAGLIVGLGYTADLAARSRVDPVDHATGALGAEPNLVRPAPYDRLERMPSTLAATSAVKTEQPPSAAATNVPTAAQSDAPAAIRPAQRPAPLVSAAPSTAVVSPAAPQLQPAVSAIKAVVPAVPALATPKPTVAPGAQLTADDVRPRDPATALDRMDLLE